jgi:hypothetical protein
MASHIGRQKFLATLGGAAAAWPLAAGSSWLGIVAKYPFERSRGFPGIQPNSGNPRLFAFDLRHCVASSPSLVRA